MKTKKGHGIFFSYDRSLADISFSVITKLEEANAEGVHYYDPIKKGHKKYD